jgi:hypothetical protein
MFTILIHIRIIGNDLSNETLPIEINIGATFHNLSFVVPILVDGMSLTSIEFDRSRPVVLYQYNSILVSI